MVVIVPLHLILALALLVWMLKSGWSFLVSLIVGFVLFNVIAVGAVMIWAFVSASTSSSGLFWFLAKTYTSCSSSCGCAARCRACASTS